MASETLLSFPNSQGKVSSCHSFCPGDRKRASRGSQQGGNGAWRFRCLIKCFSTTTMTTTKRNKSQTLSLETSPESCFWLRFLCFRRQDATCVSLERNDKMKRDAKETARERLQFCFQRQSTTIDRPMVKKKGRKKTCHSPSSPSLPAPGPRGKAPAGPTGPAL